MERGGREAKEYFQKIVLKEIRRSTNRHMSDLKVAIDIHRRLLRILVGTILRVALFFGTAAWLISTGVENAWGHALMVPLLLILAAVSLPVVFLLLCTYRIEKNLIRIKSVALCIAQDTIDGVSDAVSAESSKLQGVIANLPGASEIVRMVIDSGVLPAISAVCEKKIPVVGKPIAKAFQWIIRKTESSLAAAPPTDEENAEEIQEEEADPEPMDFELLEADEPGASMINKYRATCKAALARMDDAISAAMRVACFKAKLPLRIAIFVIGCLVIVIGAAGVLVF